MGIECYKWHKTRQVVMYMSHCTMRQTRGAVAEEHVDLEIKM